MCKGRNGGDVDRIYLWCLSTVVVVVSLCVD